MYLYVWRAPFVAEEEKTNTNEYMSMITETGRRMKASFLNVCRCMYVLDAW